jgi:hypothetical protein
LESCILQQMLLLKGLNHFLWVILESLLQPLVIGSNVLRIEVL